MMADTSAHRNQKDLMRELERAQAAEAALKQQHTNMIRTVARSPKKTRPPVAPPMPASQAPQRQKGHAQQQQRQRIAEPQPAVIPAFRPQSPTDSQDTFGREIDAAILKSVANMLQTPEPTRALRIVPLPAEAHARAANASPISPNFFTSKRRNMHCELDEPGVAVPFPHHKSKRRGFFARLLSCFAPPAQHALENPSPLVMHTPTRRRPTSAKVSPPTLQLSGEMAPLRQSLATLKPGLTAAALADGSPTQNRGDAFPTAAACENDTRARRMLRGSHGSDEIISVGPAGGRTPPTPRFTVPLLPPLQKDTWQLHHEMDHSNTTSADSPASSFESLAAELSEAESPEVEMYRRTPVAGADGRPLVQKRHQPTPEKPPICEQNPIEAAHALALQSALLKVFSVPLPPSQPAVAAAAAGGAEIKQTQVTLAALLESGGDGIPSAKDEIEQPRGQSAGAQAVHQPGPSRFGKEAAARSRSTRQQQQRARPNAHVSPIRAAKPSQNHSQHRPRAAFASHSAPVSPEKQKRGTVDSTAAAQQTAAPREGRRPAVSSEVECAIKKTEHRVLEHQHVKSAPGSRAVSPLRQPNIKPRMTKAAAARTEATQRLLQSRRQRELAHLAGMRPIHASRPSKRKDPVAASKSEADDEAMTPAKRPRSAEKRPASFSSSGETNDGYQLPPAGGNASKGTLNTRSVSNAGQQQSQGMVSQIDLSQELAAVGGRAEVPPRSPGFYQMLERLALGMSVDARRVEAAKKPSSAPSPLKEFVGLGSPLEDDGFRVDSPGSDFVLNPNALYSGMREPSPCVNVAAQKLVTLTDAVTRSNSGSSSRSGGSQGHVQEKGGIRVDASSNTLLGQLMELERSLTLDDLAALRHAIRKEGGAQEVQADD